MAGLLALLRKLFGPALLAVGLSALLAPLLFLGATDLQTGPRYRPDGGDRPPAPLVNLAATALFRAGFIRITPALDPEEAALGTRWDVVHLPHACTSDPVVKALVAAEVYMRPAWRRQMETALAEGWFALTGRAPDWSYGMAQVRLSTARAAIAQARRDHAAWLPPGPGPDVSDRGLLDLLADPCNAIRIAALVADGPRAPTDDAATIASRYRGGAPPQAGQGVLPGVVTHESLVAEMAERMLPGLVSPSLLDALWSEPHQGDLDLTQAALPPPLMLLACLPEDNEPAPGGWLYAAGPEDTETGSQPISRAQFVRALAGFDPQEARLVFVEPQAGGPGPVPDAGMESLARLAEIDAHLYPGLLRRGWAGTERRASDGTLPCTTGFGILSSMPPARLHALLGLPPATPEPLQ